MTLCAPRQIPKSKILTSPAIASKYKILDESNAEIIENTVDEAAKSRIEVTLDEFAGLNLKRGEMGVFDIEDLVSLLYMENGKDIFVARVPPTNKYVDYICIVSGKSRRHIVALAEFIKRVYKKKCNKHDLIPKIEGKNSKEWIALDLGNIALHIFSDDARINYDLETLWAVGSRYDPKSVQQEDPVVELLKHYSTYLSDLKPAK